MSETKISRPSTTSPDPQIWPLGQQALLIRFGDGYVDHHQLAAAAASALKSAHIAGVTEIAAALTSVRINFDPALIQRRDLADHVRDVLAKDDHSSHSAPRRLWTIPAVFGGEYGPQLDEAAQIAGLTADQAVDQLAASTLSVLAIGFAPGQPYLGHLAQNWNMPRQTSLTPQVPQGALVVALRQIVLFANPSPTGWRWIGQVAFKPFDTNRKTPFALRPDDMIRFEPTDRETLDALRTSDDEGLGGATVKDVP
jgi:KipI family sensor histidine kinase inhibitor